MLNYVKCVGLTPMPSLTRLLRNDILKQAGKQFGIEKYSTVSSIVERIKFVLKNERGLKKRIENLTESIIMSQRTT